MGRPEDNRHEDRQEQPRSGGDDFRDGPYGDDHDRSSRSFGERRYGGGTDDTGVPSNQVKEPTGDQRSDQRLQESIYEQLSEDESIDASEISILVARGAVTLDGSVGSRRSKYNVEKLAERCGAQGIVNNLRIVTSDGETSPSE